MVRVVKTEDGHWTIEYPFGLSRRAWCTRAMAEHVARVVAVGRGLEYTEA